MKRWLPTIFLIPGLALLLYDYSSVTRACGRYQLTVELPPELATEVAGIRYEPIYKDSFGDAILYNLDASLPEMHTADSADNSFIAMIGHSYKESPLGYKYDYFQYTQLIVVLQLADGTRSVYRLEIPHKDVSRRVVLSSENQIPRP